MNKDIIILVLLLVIVSLLGIIFYLLVTDEPKAKAPESCQHFPADEIMENIRKDFDSLTLKLEAQGGTESSGSMPARERTLPRKRPMNLTPEWTQTEPKGRAGGRA